MDSSGKRCDLHTHSTHSDGTISPSELVRLAKKAGLSCIALTDHDTASGTAEAQAEGLRAGLEVIAGVEVSVQFEPGTLHILGYFIDRNSKKLKMGLEEVQEARRKRNPQIIEKLKACGFEITLEEVAAESGGKQVGRPHFAGVLVKKGYVKNADEAFKKYLAKGQAAYVNKRVLSSKEAIEMIEDAGGLAVLAHPKQLKLDGESKRLESEIERLRGEGLKGIEAYSSCQSRREAAGYLALADRFGLFVTGGSDFHGANKPDVSIGWLGNGVSLPYETVDRMKHLLLSQKLR